MWKWKNSRKTFTQLSAGKLAKKFGKTQDNTDLSANCENCLIGETNSPVLAMEDIQDNDVLSDGCLPLGNSESEAEI